MGTERQKIQGMTEILKELFRNEKIITTSEHKSETESSYLYSVTLSTCEQGQIVNDWYKYLVNLDRLTAQSHNLHTALLVLNCNYGLNVQGDNFILHCEIDKSLILNSKSLFGYLTYLHSERRFLQPKLSSLFIDMSSEEFIYSTDCTVYESSKEVDFESVIGNFEKSMSDGFETLRHTLDFNYDLNTSKVFFNNNECVRIETKIKLNTFPLFLAPDTSVLKLSI